MSLVLNIDIPSRSGSLRHVMPARPETACRIIAALAALIPDATWTVEDGTLR